MHIVYLTFPAITPLDLVGPMEVLARVPKASFQLVAPEAAIIDTPLTGLAFKPEPLSAATKADVLLVPGGLGTRALVDDEATLDWLKTIDATTRFTTSVCTGSLLLAKAGLLDGRAATTHWCAADTLNEYGARYVERRVVESDKYITAAGVSSGIDMALALAANLAGDTVAQAIQLSIEYAPEPPFDVGVPSKAPKALRDIVMSAQQALEDGR